jgi:3-deoxy-7-phosphoheptulonate synthase
MRPIPLVNANIAGRALLPTPRHIQEILPVSEASRRTVSRGRQAIRDILDGKDGRLLLVVGPCSIHDPEAALEYAGRLKGLADRVADRFLVAMRVYFEKPRTTLGWKGLIHDPRLDDSFRVAAGLKLARKLLLDITRLGLSTAAEALDPITTQYLAGLVCWHAIGARTVESQTHRDLASGLSSSVGFKNGTDGNVQVAIDALRAARRPHHFLGVDPDGRASVFRTRGNPHGHVVLRGGGKPNYDRASVARCARALARAGLPPRVMIDCSHGNSQKDHRRQPAVFAHCASRVRRGDKSIMGLMVESHLREGKQPIPRDPRLLKYGVSITDPCLGWEATERMILGA